MKIREKIKKYNIFYRIFVPFILFGKKIVSFVMGRKAFLNNRRNYKKMFSNSAKESGSFVLSKKYELPALYDRFAEAGGISTYFWQDLWAAKLVAENKPINHYDIGSRVDGFIGHLASFRDNIVLIDVRPLESVIPGVKFIQANATNLAGIEDDSVESLSALCSLEHFGLGRYGDDVDPDAWYKAIKSIVRVMKKGGKAYISVPIGKEHLEFDSHRIFKAETVVRAFLPMKLLSFSVTKYGDKNLHEDVDIHTFDEYMGERCTIFGLFYFEK